MSDPVLRWCAESGLVYRRADDGTWIVLDAVAEADPTAVADAESLCPASGPDPGFHRMLLRTGIPVVTVMVVLVVLGGLLLGAEVVPGLIWAVLPVAFVAWVGWIVWLASRSQRWDDRWMA